MMENVLQVRTSLVSFYVLRDSEGLYLIDCGFIGGWRRLKESLRHRGWDEEPIKGIIVTHGHLDHILNVGSIAERTGAWIAAPRLDEVHYQGNPNYSGLSKITGCLEGVGRSLLNFRSFEPKRLLDEGDFLDVWQGLTVVHLPGHTAGHSGLYCEKLQLLFCADLFASFKRFSHFPPSILNVDSSQMRRSVEKVLGLPLKGVIPNHADQASPEAHLKRLRELSKR